MTADDLQQRLLSTFLIELDEQAAAMSDALLALERESGATEPLAALFRSAHTIKGAARIVGQSEIEEACHVLEEYFAALRDRRTDFAPEHAQPLFRAIDALGDAGRRVRAGESLADAPVAQVPELLAALTTDIPSATAAPTATPPLRAAPQQAARESPTATASDDVPAAAATEATTKDTVRSGDSIRVDSDKVEALHNRAGELVVAATRLVERQAELDALRSWIDAWLADERDAAHGRAARGERETPAATAARERIEQLRMTFTQLWRALRDDIRAMKRVSSDSAAAVLELRLRPVGDALEGLPRAARDVAAASSKRVTVELSGEDVQADRLVVDALREPLLHLVRNAVDHGIEEPAVRRRAGKPESGTVRIAAELVEGRIRITVADDGRGLDAASLRERLRQHGHRVPRSDRDLVRAIFAGGVTTRGHATNISGRGVGLDLVRVAVERIRGSVNVRWQPGEGTRFIIETPPSPTTLRAVLVACGPQVLAIPSLHIERLLRVAAQRVRMVEGRPSIVVGDDVLPLVPLASILDATLPQPRAGEHHAVVLLAVADRRIGVIVDEFVAEQDLVVRPLEGAAAAVPHMGGGALLASGRVALVLHAPSVLDAGLGLADFELPGTPAAAPARRARVLVVDDSITTRALEQSVLEAAGYSVATAVDGYDGWRKLQESGADIVVADVEMPRMDGFTLCETIRGSEKFASLPVILVTALESPEHRARGLEAGADAYLTKAAFDQEMLLETIRQLLD